MGKYLFVGTINEGNKPRGGAEAKNQIILEKLKAQLGENLVFVDVSSQKINGYSLLKLLWRLATIKRIIFSVASPTLEKLSYFNFYLRYKTIIIIIVGGVVHKKIEKNKKLKRLFENAKFAYAQTTALVENIRKASSKINASYLPNFKPIPIVAKSSKIQSSSDIHLLYLSRVERHKGIFRAIDLVKDLNENSSGFRYRLDIYGRMDLRQNELFEFESLIKNDDLIAYKGFLNLNESGAYERLCRYHFFLFLTEHEGEGFPGVIIDAMIAQIPIIASDWAFNREILPEGNLIVNLNSEKYVESIKKYIQSVQGMSDEDYALLLKSLSDEVKKYDVDRVTIPL